MSYYRYYALCPVEIVKSTENHLLFGGFRNRGSLLFTLGPKIFRISCSLIPEPRPPATARRIIMK